MPNELKVSAIGLDTSHTIEFTRRLQAPDCAPEQRVEGARVVNCLRFPTPFQSEEGLNARQAQMEEWGVKVTTDFDEAVAGCDALLVTINDPAYHLEYFTKCAGLGLPVFLDKPLADNVSNGRAICDLAREKGLRVMSCSSLRFVPGLASACEAVSEPQLASTFGSLGTAPAGSSIVWYGVHAFEMLQRAMGRGAVSIKVTGGPSGAVCVVDYPDRRRGVVELGTGEKVYGGCLRSGGKAAPYVADSSRLYADQLRMVVDFFSGKEAPLTLDDSLEVMAMLDAASRSAESGKEEGVKRQ